MEEERKELESELEPELGSEPTPAAEERPRYVPRPRWQVWLARIGLVVFLLALIMYYIHYFRGGR